MHLGHARLDTDRYRRTGDPEVVLGTGKTPGQVVDLLSALAQAHPDRAVLATRLAPEALRAVARELPAARLDPVAAAAALGPVPNARGMVCVVTAGTADLPVATEVVLTAEVFGAGVRLVGDVGVAGLHRLLTVRDELADADCLVVVAGMEGALPSVVGGLVGVPLVAVPTSVGYGASFAGVAALLGMLNSCAPGVTVVNIDNGFGAGVFAARVARAAAPRPAQTQPARTQPERTDEDPPRDPPRDPSGEPTEPPAAATRIGWLDVSAGISGDMFLGALVDSGVPLQVLQAAADAVVPGQVRLRAETVPRAGLRALRVHVDIESTEGTEGTTRATAGPTTGPTAEEDRTWVDIRALLGTAALDSAVRDLALGAFTRLAEAEAEVHGTAVDEVRFHEVGALDAIADVVGACAGLHHLGLDSLAGSPVAVGGGSVDTTHGLLPVPVPAVAALLAGVPSGGGPVDAELATPTGAALLVSTVDRWGRQPAMVVETVGVGAGARDHPGHPNVVRLLVGTATDPVESTSRPATPRDQVSAPTAPVARGTRPLLLQTNVDDLDPRLWPGVLARLFETGASDAWLTPILMKKGRPAHTLSVLLRPELRDVVERVVFAETTAIGLRVQEVDKVALERSELVVRVGDHPVRVKVASRDGGTVNLQPEYEDVVGAARADGRPVKAVLAEAAALARSVAP